MAYPAPPPQPAQPTVAIMAAQPLIDAGAAVQQASAEITAADGMAAAEAGVAAIAQSIPANVEVDAESLAPRLEFSDPQAEQPRTPAIERETFPSFTELPRFSSPAITEPLIDFDALSSGEQSIIPTAPALPSELVTSTEPITDAVVIDSPIVELSPEEPSTASPSTVSSPATASSPDLTGILEIEADNQVFDQQRQIITAEGEVLMRFQSGVLSADRVQINLLSRIVVANGNAGFVRGQQRLRGDRIEYNITQDSGRVTQASGELYTPSSGTDLLLGNAAAPNLVAQPESDRITQTRPLTSISNPGQITITTGFSTNFETQDVDDGTNSPVDAIQIPISISTFRQEGQINRWRFESDEIALVPGGFDAAEARLTNDPFSPPQFEIRAEKIEVRSISPLVDEILATRPRYVFEDKVSIPTFRRRIVLDRRPRDDGLFTFGYDDRDRGGLFIERGFEPITTERLRFNITPQFYVQRSLFDSESQLDNFGFKTGLEAQLTPSTLLTGSARLTTLNPDNLADNTRAQVELSQAIPLGHTLDLNYGYRNRVYNGSLGFRTVRQNYGAVVRSPNIPIGNTGIVVNYQGGLQSITADTDRIELLEPIRDNNRVTLTRYQVGASASRGFSLWRGQSLPATAEEGLRFSPIPLTPFANLSVGLTGLYSGYSSGDSQDSVTATLGLNGHVGHFSKNWLDYTGWNLTYSQALRGEQSPFTFDRVEDTQVLAFGLRQQVYGPIRFGLQSSLSLSTGERFSTDYLLEYSRRAYGVEFRYNPVLELGSVTLRLSDFNWLGGTDPFREVNTGVQQ